MELLIQMSQIIIREPMLEDEEVFIAAMQRSQFLHHPWVQAPVTSDEFSSYLLRYQQPNNKSFLVFDPAHEIAGVININEIIRGLFQSAYLGFYAVIDHAGRGYMSLGLKLVLKHVFHELGLHRLEANIQHENTRSIHLVKKHGFRYEGYSPRYLKINHEWKGHERWAITHEDYIRDDESIIKQDHVEILPYRSDWTALAEEEMAQLKKALSFLTMLDIQHVGSTAIPGVCAKPVIDLQIAVSSISDVKYAIIPELQKLGYEYWYENPDPKKMFFVKGMPPYGDRRTHHVHIFEHDSEHWRHKIIFRDYLRNHPEIQQEYVELKRALAKEHAEDREKYTNAKLDFVTKVLTLAKA